ncbi:MAG TPA: SH3 domain-containing protein [Leptolyngbyaceae cyanobacterium M65_K2018_010]|nr:SH3 domain-containing protein [Leptolyngbyaceae cyanobacterium M65_K2018_010]
MKGVVTALLLGLLAAACQRPAGVSPEPEPSDLATPVPEPEVQIPAPEATPTATPPPAPATPIKTGTVRAEPSLRIHTAPGTNTPVIYAAPNGTRLEIFAETAMGDSVWYQVRSNLSSQLGWAYGGNIAVDGQAGLTSDRPPPPSNLAMTCSGSLSNGSNFTINYTRESGFSRFTLTSGNAEPMTASLTYSGTTEAQHGVWKGTLSESEVRVDHLSNQPPKPGDEVSVLYNIFTGRGVCR